MKNFSVNVDGQEFWISRSVAVAVFVWGVDDDDNLCILACKRGSGCPDNVGKWVCPCGYLDYNETVQQAAIREVFEETGVQIKESDLENQYIDSNPAANHQNVTIMYDVYLNKTKDYTLSSEHSEPNEVDEIKWIPEEEINNYEWAFGHNLIING